jgi:hypothetical protein
MAWESLATHVLRPLSADLAVLASFRVGLQQLQSLGAMHIWRIPECVLPGVFRTHACTCYVNCMRWMHHRYDDWEKLLNALLPRGWKQRVKLTNNLWGGIAGMRGSGALIFAFRLVLLHYLDALAAGAPAAYDRVILTRSDHVYA